ncbi:hypothetical protein [Streptomyces daliensis]|uniref:Uncharacterized protein n=1 Tax=Streptomyces daliensis TaxID=299421 RepID=A0A8T4IRB7_9ACTN|nr:hypothetical protein [Streptomyces daliensis]
MSAQPVEPSGWAWDEAIFEMPPSTEAALRIAVKRLDLVAAAEFEQEFRAAWQEAVQTDSTVPMHTFLHRWGVWVEMHRFPARAAHLHELEAAVDRAPSTEEARRAAEQVGKLLAVASAARTSGVSG